MARVQREWLPYAAGLAAITLIVVSLGTVAFYLERQRYLERAQQATSNIVELQVQNVGKLFDKIDVALQSGVLYYQRQLISGPFSADQLDDYLRNLESVVTEVDGIRILDENGWVRYGHNIPTNPRTDLSDRGYFLQARNDARNNGKLIVDGPLFARIAQKWVVVFARRLNKPDGSFAGVIYANLETRMLERVLSSVELGPNGAASVRTADLALVHRVPEAKSAVGSNNVSLELRDVVAAHPEGGSYVAATAIDGVERSNVYRKVGNYPFYVIVGVAMQDFLGSSPQNVMLIVGLALMTIVVSAVAARRGYRAHQRMVGDLRERNALNVALQDALRERERLNADLAQKAREAQAASMAKSAFLANMSHELRTPLHQIHGLAHLLGRESPGKRQGEWLKSLENSVQHMTALVDAVLELTRIESGSVELSEQPLDLPALVDEVAGRFRAEAAGKQLTLTVREVVALSGLVGDHDHIRQALSNYLSNALRFTRAGGIEVRTALLREDAASVVVRFEVEDSGLGIKPEDLPRLFSIFEQVDNSSTRQYGGLGIGLAITRKIAQALGGEAGCDSVYGQGSRFWFSVRLKKQRLGAN